MAIVDSKLRVERVKAAAELFVYGYPMVSSLEEMAGFAEGTAACR